LAGIAIGIVAMKRTIDHNLGEAKLSLNFQAFLTNGSTRIRTGDQGFMRPLL
jgi:hypothetical protein